MIVFLDPVEPGCWIYAPNGCDRWGRVANQFIQDSHDGSSTNRARCLQRAAEFDGWCPTTGTIAVYNAGDHFIYFLVLLCFYLTHYNQTP